MTNEKNNKITKAYLSIMPEEKIACIEEKIGYKFNEPYLLAQAFTRASFSEETQYFEDNEKLEFVGDKVLDFVVVKKLVKEFGFSSSGMGALPLNQRQSWPDDYGFVETQSFIFKLSEGDMTDIKKQIVSTGFLSKAIERLGLENYLIMNNGDIKQNVQEQAHVKEDLFEAILGAIAIDSNWNMLVLDEVVEKMLSLEYHIQNGVEDGIDYISYVNNWFQKEHGEAPTYIFENNGSNEIFQCTLSLKNGGYFEGFGYSQKEAKRIAAKGAYKFLEEKKKRMNRVREAVREFDIETAIAGLQLLQDKRIITGPEYIFEELAPTEKTNGNPRWSCVCKVDDIVIEYIASNKKSAKKAAAYTTLEILATGHDTIMESICNQNTEKVKIIESICNQNTANETIIEYRH